MQLSLEKKQKEEERRKTFELEQLKATREAREVEIMQLEEQEKWSNFVQGKVEDLNAAENEVLDLFSYNAYDIQCIVCITF